MTAWHWAVVGLMAVGAAGLGVSWLVHTSRRSSYDPAIDELLEQGRFNYTYSKHAPVGSYDEAKALAGAKRARSHARDVRRTADSRFASARGAVEPFGKRRA